MGARMRGLGARVVAMMIKAGEILAMANAVPYSTLEERLGGGGLVVIAPHPDDESLACGGLIAEAYAQGRLVRVVIVSDGTGSQTTDLINDDPNGFRLTDSDLARFDLPYESFFESV